MSNLWFKLILTPIPLCFVEIVIILFIILVFAGCYVNVKWNLKFGFIQCKIENSFSKEFFRKFWMIDDFAWGREDSVGRSLFLAAGYEGGESLACSFKINVIQDRNRLYLIIVEYRWSYCLVWVMWYMFWYVLRYRDIILFTNTCKYMFAYL